MDRSESIRVFVAEDHAIVRKGICALLAVVGVGHVVSIAHPIEVVLDDLPEEVMPMFEVQLPISVSRDRTRIIP